MGVDYDASFGIGFVVEPSEVKHLMYEQDEDLDIDEMDDGEVMECLNLPDGLGYAYWGNSYSGHHTYMIKATPDATSKEQIIKQWELLDKFIEDNKLEGKKVGLIGGGLVW